MFSQHLECAHFIRQMFANSNETVENILLATDPNLLQTPQEAELCRCQVVVWLVRKRR